MRLVLTLAGMALGALAGNAGAVLRRFLAMLVEEQFIVPIGSAVAFAYVLRHAGCDRHLVHLLVGPVRRVRPLLVPGTVLVGFLVNAPVISQAATAVTVGPVVLPLLRAAGLSPATGGAALLLGASLGGEFLNPGSPELQSVRKAVAEHRGVDYPAAECVARARTPLLVHLAVAAAGLWAVCAWADRRGLAPRSGACPRPSQEEGDRHLADARSQSPAAPSDAADSSPFRVNLVKAMVPLVPLVLLSVTGPPLNWVRFDPAWLGGDTRKVGAAMLVGIAVALAAGGKASRGAGGALLRGFGYAYANVILIIVAATTFGEGVKQLGFDQLLGDAIGQRPGLLWPSAAVLPGLFALVCGSGMAATQSLFGFFVGPAEAAGADPAAVGALVSIAAAAGRTMSPVAAVVLLCARLTGARPLALVRRVAPPLLAGVAAVLALRGFLPGW